MKRYRVSAAVTISIWTEVDADSEEQALEMAEAMPMPSLGREASGVGRRNRHGLPETWLTSGELDGSPFDLEADEVES